MRPTTTILALALILVSACNGTGDTQATDEPTDPSSPTSTSVATTTTAASTTTASTTTASTTSSSAPTTTATGEETVRLTARCDSPEGYAVSYPEEWSTNPGEVLAKCSRFHPEPFDVPQGTDERVAAIAAYVDPVPFTEVAAPDDTRDADRAVTTVDGLQAVRLAYETGGEGLWPEGTPVTLYAIDVGTDSGSRTLIVDTIGLSQFDYRQNQQVLDRMVRTLDIQMQDVDDDPGVVARYGGGGGGFSVEGTISGEQACLRIPPQGEEVCTDLPAPDQLHTIQLENLQPVLAGVTGGEVHAVTAHRQDGSTSTVLPVAIGDSEVRGFSFPFGMGEIQRFVLTDVEGNELRTIEPGP